MNDVAVLQARVLKFGNGRQDPKPDLPAGNIALVEHSVRLFCGFQGSFLPMLEDQDDGAAVNIEICGTQDLIHSPASSAKRTSEIEIACFKVAGRQPVACICSLRLRSARLAGPKARLIGNAIARKAIGRICLGRH